MGVPTNPEIGFLPWIGEEKEERRVGIDTGNGPHT